MHNIRKYCVYSLLAVTPLGFLFKIYTGPAQRWFNDYGAGLLYEIFWILVVFLIFPKEKLIHKITVWVFIVTCALEMLQLSPLHQQLHSMSFKDLTMAVIYGNWSVVRVMRTGLVRSNLII